MQVRATFWNAYNLATSRGIMWMDTPSNETLTQIVEATLIEEKGYPSDTKVTINGDDPMALVLVVEPNGSWELV